MGLKIEKVSKTYGNKKVVDSISFEMSKPGVYGLLGANGAGSLVNHFCFICHQLDRDFHGKDLW